MIKHLRAPPEVDTRPPVGQHLLARSRPIELTERLFAHADTVRA